MFVALLCLIDEAYCRNHTIIYHSNIVLLQPAQWRFHLALADTSAGPDIMFEPFEHEMHTQVCTWANKTPDFVDCSLRAFARALS